MNTSSTYYIAITLGPVLDTLNAAQKTRELWAASYFLSYLMREITKKLEGSLGDKGAVLLPSTALLSEQGLLGAGLYPDRIYVQAMGGDPAVAHNRVRSAYVAVVEDSAKRIHADLERLNGDFIGKEGTYINPFSIEDCKGCLMQYLKIYAADVEVAEGKNIIDELATVADTLDLQPRILSEERPAGSNPGGLPVDEDNRNPLQRLFYLANWSFLFEDGFGVKRPRLRANEARVFLEDAALAWNTDAMKRLQRGTPKPKRSFDSLIEIGSRELAHLAPRRYEKIIEDELIKEQLDSKVNSGVDLDEESVVKSLRDQFKTEFKDYHKYVAIVHADGDNVGKIVKAVGNRADDIPGFSRALLDFAKIATEEVVRYGGAPVYMGGDDMLFFAPVCNRRLEEVGARQNLFDLLALLDQEFERLVAGPYRGRITAIYEQDGTPAEVRSYPTLSYGISVTFHKFPLYEAKSLSHANLEHVKTSVDGKNAIKFTLMKHSGQVIPFLLPKAAKFPGDETGSVWTAFRDLVASTNASDDFLASFCYKLDTMKPMLKAVAQDGSRLENFFANNFNENFRLSANKGFYDSLIQFIVALAGYSEGLTDESFELLYGALRFIHFIHHQEIKEHEQVVQG